jgi:hypothetical protein
MPIQSRNKKQQRRRSLKMRGGEEKDIMDKLVEIEGKIDGLNSLIMQGQPTEEVPEEVSPVIEDAEGAATGNATGTGDASTADASTADASTAEGTDASTAEGTDASTAEGTATGTGDASTGDDNGSKQKLETDETDETPEITGTEMPGGRRNSRRRRQKNNRKSQRRQRRR